MSEENKDAIDEAIEVAEEHVEVVRKKFLRHRNFFLFIGSVIALVLSFYLNPDKESGVLTAFSEFIQGVWAIAAAHWCRKALMDYPEADWQVLFQKARDGSTGAGLALLAGSILFFGLLLVFSPRARADEMSPNFYKYKDVVLTEQQHYWPNMPEPSTLFGLVEKESGCTTQKVKRCWNPAAQLKSAREEGAGVGQLTRTFS